MKRTTEFLKHAVTRIDRDDGTILLTSDYTLGPVTDRTGDWLHNWADKAGDRVFIACTWNGATNPHFGYVR